MERLKSIPSGTLTSQMPTLALADIGVVTPVDVERGLCQWLHVTSDLLEIEDGSRAEAKWRGTSAPEYIVVKVPDGSTCFTSSPEKRVYVLIKQMIKPTEASRIVEIELTRKDSRWRYGVETLVSRSGGMTHISFERHSHTDSRAKAAFGFFSYPGKTNATGEVPMFFRLTLPLDVEIVASDKLAFSARVEYTTRASATVAAAKFEHALPALSATQGGKRLLPSTSVEESLLPYLLPCESVDVTLQETRILVSKDCMQPSVELHEGLNRILGKILAPSIPFRSRRFENAGMSMYASATGEPEVLRLLPEVRSFAATAGLGVIILFAANVIASRSLRRRVRTLAGKIERAMAGGLEEDFTNTKDSDLGVLAEVALQAIAAIDRERALRSQVVQEQAVEQARVRVFEDRTYIISHELRNFVSVVQINVQHDPLIQARAQLAARMLQAVSQITNRQEWRPEFLEASRATTMWQIFDDWWKTLGSRKRDELHLADDFQARAGIATVCVPSLVHQILDKFLENALEHREGTMAIVVSLEEDQSEFVAISLTNRHTEIDAERAEALFRPALHLSGERMRGFGLLAAREYALAAGGFVSAISRYPNVAFCVFLPRAGGSLSEESACQPVESNRY